MAESVNFMKLTKTEERVLVALLEPASTKTYALYPDKGNDQAGIGKIIYGYHAQSPYRGQGYRLRFSVKTMLSRSLNSLWKKGLVFRCKPFYGTRGNGDFPYLRKLKGLKVYSWRLVHDEVTIRNNLEPIEGLVHEETMRTSVYGWARLPHYTKVWWILTDEGEKLANHLKEVGNE
ncbi:MAG: hypothetical protein ACFFER_19165 [Candidatus Thorarchaeota archaeon]